MINGRLLVNQVIDSNVRYFNCKARTTDIESRCALLSKWSFHLGSIRETSHPCRFIDHLSSFQLITTSIDSFLPLSLFFRGDLNNSNSRTTANIEKKNHSGQSPCYGLTFLFDQSVITDVFILVIWKVSSLLLSGKTITR